MKKISRLWFVLALAVGMASTPVRAVDPEEEGDIPAAAASAAGMNMLEESLNQESQSAAQDPTGKELPNLSLALFDSEAHGSRIGKALASVPSQDKDRMLKNALDKFGFFAAKGGSRLASVAETIEGIQHENMYRLILQAFGEGAQDYLTYVQKSALQHQFLGYEVYYKDEVKKDAWLGHFSKVWGAGTDGGLLAFINNAYQEITAETEAIDTDHYWVVRHSQLAGLKDHITDLLPADADGPQPTIVIDIDAPRPEFHMSKNELPNRLVNLVLTNADESVQTIGDCFLCHNESLQAVHLDLPALTGVGDYLLSGCERLTTFILNAPQLLTVGRSFLAGNDALNNVHLNVPLLVTVGGSFLTRNDALNNVYLYAPRLKSAGDSFLSKNAALDDPFLVMPALKTFGYFFLSENNVLKNAHLVMPTLKTIGPSFLYKNEALETVHLDLPVLENVELYPLFFCPNISSILVPVDQLERLRNLFPKKVKGLLASAFACEL